MITPSVQVRHGGLAGSHNALETLEWKTWGFDPGITNSTFNLAPVSP